MDLWILSSDFKKLGIVDTARSIIWANRFRECGDFEIYVAASAEMIELLQEERLVMRADDNMVGIIEKIIVSSIMDEGDFLIVSGRCLRSIFDRRIIWDQTVLSGNLETAMRQLITDAFISPAIEERKYTALTLAAAHGYTETVSTQYTGTALLEAIVELCAAYDYGFTITLGDNCLVVDFIKGVDRSTNQSAVPHVIFSPEQGNLLKTTYTRDKTLYKSVALVAGEGEGTARRSTTVQRSVDLTGLARREMFVDARDISSNEGEIADAEYLQMLAERGSQDLATAAFVESMGGNIDAEKLYIYKKDYNLGDRVTVINKYGVQATTQVLEIVETWDETGYTMTPTFG